MTSLTIFLLCSNQTANYLICQRILLCENIQYARITSLLYCVPLQTVHEVYLRDNGSSEPGGRDEER